jgi:hypothetical protein
MNAATEWKVRAEHRQPRQAQHQARAQSLNPLRWRATNTERTQDIVIEALKGALILAILERLCLTRNSTWLEARAIDDACAHVCPAAACCKCSHAAHRARFLHLHSAKQEHIDYLSVQSLLFQQNTLGIAGQLKLFFTHTRRLKD